MLAGAAVAACLLLVLPLSLALNAMALLSLGRVSTSMAGRTESAQESPVDAPVPVPLTEDLDAVPRDAAAFATFRVGDLWKRLDVQELLDLLTGAKVLSPADLLSEVGKPLGAGPGDLERVSVFNLAMPADPPSNVVVFTTVKPYTMAAAEQKLEARGLKRLQFRGYYYYTGGPGGRENVLRLGDHPFVTS